MIYGHEEFGGGSNCIGAFNNYSCIGGEATLIAYDINFDNIIIAAGAGGGAGYHRTSGEAPDGFGGPFAEDGYGSASWFTPEQAKKTRGKGATSEASGYGGEYLNSASPRYCKAKRGQKIRGGDSCCKADASSGGGGAGYFGGGDGADIASGGGGSSYAHPSLMNVNLLGGDKFFPDPINQQIAIKGKKGNGFIKVTESNPYTFVKLSQSCNPALIKCSCINFNQMRYLIGLGFFILSD
ncbi:serine protease, putative [Trichomonas vaginalis G3]|uniref:receptor protein-tyrosine kinase n=1 Tax=Trichomonas vaginalis (strain ATCC PRA-98 / G3) TaxID=412133 RepID=A2G7T2_TRIV3|nr:glycine-rich protein family [Trichomonas vaginalis G3]EAX86789.1 serine protease, putative [Trichomonas vaginalis G3]KAI5537701.1 glycine-rich protein family [Trichomonas vaginalis G3]|eukprot:XP_001299719.1 serine protease [Trichomonas vaginalis G3]